LEINFKFQYFQIKPSFTTLYKRRHIPGFVATDHILSVKYSHFIIVY